MAGVMTVNESDGSDTLAEIRNGPHVAGHGLRTGQSHESQGGRDSAQHIREQARSYEKQPAYAL